MDQSAQHVLMPLLSAARLPAGTSGHISLAEIQQHAVRSTFATFVGFLTAGRSFTIGEVERLEALKAYRVLVKRRD